MAAAWARWIVAAWVLSAGWASAAPADLEDSCGVAAVRTMAWLAGLDRQAAVESGGATLAELEQLGAAWGVQLKPVNGRLSDYLATGRPAILHLGSPDHYVVLLDADAARVMVADGGPTRIHLEPRAAFEARVSGYGLVPALAAPADRPSLQVTAAFRDLGTTLGASAQVAFSLRNDGRLPLGLRVESRSCRCTTSSWEQRTLAPGEAVGLDVAMQPASNGPYSGFVVLRTNDPARPRIILWWQGVLGIGPSASPARLVIPCTGTAAPTRQVTLSGPADMAVVSVVAAHPAVEAVLGSVSRTHDRTAVCLRVLVHLDQPLTAPATADLRVVLATPQRAELTVPVELVPRSLVEAVPAVLALGNVGREAVRRTVWLHPTDNEPLIIGEVWCRGLGASLVSVVRGVDGWLAVTLELQPMAPGLVDTELRLRGVRSTASAAAARPVEIVLPTCAHVLP